MSAGPYGSGVWLSGPGAVVRYVFSCWRDRSARARETCRVGAHGPDAPREADFRGLQGPAVSSLCPGPFRRPASPPAWTRKSKNSTFVRTAFCDSTTFMAAGVRGLFRRAQRNNRALSRRRRVAAKPSRDFNGGRSTPTAVVPRLLRLCMYTHGRYVLRLVCCSAKCAYAQSWPAGKANHGEKMARASSEGP